MNSKLTLTLMRLVSMRRSHEQGFALPVAMAIGLVIVLLGAVMMTRSHDDRVTASTQKANTQGLNATETAVVRYQSLINSNRAIAVYPHTGTVSWANASSIPGLSSCSTSGNSTTVANNSTTAWQDVDSTDSSRGQYRLISYSYQPTSGSGTATPGTGTLIVEGRVNQSGSGSSATKDVSTSTTRVLVKVAVNSGSVYSIPIPGLWLKSGATSNNSNGNTIDADVLLNDCNASLSNVTVASGRTKNYTTMSFPSLPTKPTFVTSPTSHVLGNINSTTAMANLGATNLNGQHKRLTLPRTGDTANSSGVYEYSVSSLAIPNNSELVITAGQKVKFYLDGNISSGGDIKHDCTGVSGCKSTNFQIFGYASSGQICMNGNNYIQAFIFAPNYSMGVAGSGGGAGGLKGTAWVNSWSNGGGCGSNTSNTVVVQTGTWDDIGLTPGNIPPLLGNISNWQRQEVP